jgi:regulator of replication initiation timing
VPSDQQATAESLRQQLRAYREEIARLRVENQALKDQVARGLGAARAASVTEAILTLTEDMSTTGEPV